MKFKIFIPLVLALLTGTSCIREHNVKIFGTNDIHGAYFPESYTDSTIYPSLSQVSFIVDEYAKRSSEDNIVLIDCGDNLQGNNASYYYNFVDTSGNAHLLGRIFNFMKYDAVVVGNHDLEAGHSVYDGIKSDYKGAMLAANAIDLESGDCYFDEYVILDKGGLKIAVIGFTNPNVKSWISPDKYKGMDFLSISSVAQSLVNRVQESEKPDFVILALHSGLGSQEHDSFENCAYFIASIVKGIDLVMAAHDHKSVVTKIYNGEDSVTVVEAGSRLENLSYIDVTLKKKWGKVVGKEVTGMLLKPADYQRSTRYDAEFAEDFRRVKEFSNMYIGRLLSEMDMNFDKEKESQYMKFIHQLQLSQEGVEISINAPLASKGVIPAGALIYNDLFTLYRFENLLYVVQMKGEEVKSYLEAAYEKRLSDDGPLYNMDSAAGLIYTVSKSAPYGSRVKILSMADGSRFDKDRIYNVAMTSYRASGAGGLLLQAGISQDSMNERVVAILPEIRELLYKKIISQGEIDPRLLDKDKNIGYWKFVK